MNEQTYWEAVLQRDRAYDGRFVYAVRSTGIYCRPTCPSRRPNREQVHFFTSSAQAQLAGYRPCRRCLPDQAAAPDPQRALVEGVCRYLEAAPDRYPTLQELSGRFNASPYHLQRTFKRLVGVTPRQYAAARRTERLKERLRADEDVTTAIYQAGYGGSSAVYGSSDAELGMPPGRYRHGGQGMAITYAIVPCALGWLLAAATERGLCVVRLGDAEQELEAGLCAEFPAAALHRDDAGLGEPLQALLRYLEGQATDLDLPVDVQATAFQRRVWQALQEIPYGATRSYQEVAGVIGAPTAARAVARACATNPVALVVPCHRVVRKDGSLGGYRWGIARKRALLDQEARQAGLSEDTGVAPAS
ncbi:MAG: bifunctional DNA-binding transcriptional regulator/O6-methylguanine-DNA methyltransferase Ada [Anaerolineae bacterium]